MKKLEEDSCLSYESVVFLQYGLEALSITRMVASFVLEPRDLPQSDLAGWLLLADVQRNVLSEQPALGIASMRGTGHTHGRFWLPRHARSSVPSSPLWIRTKVRVHYRRAFKL